MSYYKIDPRNLKREQYHSSKLKNPEAEKLSRLIQVNAKELRIKCYVSELAQKSGISKSIVYDYLNGKIFPNNENLEKLLDAMGMDLKKWEDYKI
ncbi:MAG: helix-turn-helix domain-containing protein [Nanoarchaeota archaeon]